MLVNGSMSIVYNGTMLMVRSMGYNVYLSALTSILPRKKCMHHKIQTQNWSSFKFSNSSSFHGKGTLCSISLIRYSYLNKI